MVCQVGVDWDFFDFVIYGVNVGWAPLKLFINSPTDPLVKVIKLVRIASFGFLVDYGFEGFSWHILNRKTHKCSNGQDFRNSCFELP